MREKHCVVRPMTAVLVDSELSVIPVWYGWRGRTFSSSEHVPHFASLHVKLPSYRDNVMRSPNHLSGHDHQSLSFTKFCQKKNDVRSIHGTAYKYNKCQSRLSGPQPQVCRSVGSIISTGETFAFRGTFGTIIRHLLDRQSCLFLSMTLAISHQANYRLTHLVGSAYCFFSDFRPIIPKSWIRFPEPLRRVQEIS